VLFGSGCSPTYVLRAGYEEAKILWRRQPIDRLLSDPQLDARTRVQLETVQLVRRFAADTLRLRVGGSYSTLSEVDGQQAVHVVTAARRFELRPHLWWFPIIGNVPYKGYFDASEAAAEARRLEASDHDTLVRPAIAFSTLGWFDDPVLSTVLRYERVLLAESILHELLHNTVYVAGHADFDESFATFVGHRGCIEFFSSLGDTAALQRATAAWSDALRFSDFLEALVQRLRAAYAMPMTPAQRDDLFESAQLEFRALPMQTSRYSDFGARPLNNAIILHEWLYARALRSFEAVAQRQPDLARTVELVISSVKRRSATPFDALAELARAAQTETREKSDVGAVERRGQ
jgi:predicted aminopeptidase